MSGKGRVLAVLMHSETIHLRNGSAAGCEAENLTTASSETIHLRNGFAARCEAENLTTASSETIHLRNGFAVSAI